MPAREYCKRPKELPEAVEAIQWTGDNFDEVADFCFGPYGNEYQTRWQEGTLQIWSDPEHRWVNTFPSCWVIRDKAGDTYPFERDLFEATYEPADRHST